MGKFSTGKDSKFVLNMQEHVLTSKFKNPGACVALVYELKYVYEGYIFSVNSEFLRVTIKIGNLENCVLFIFNQIVICGYN